MGVSEFATIEFDLEFLTTTSEHFFIIKIFYCNKLKNLIFYNPSIILLYFEQLAWIKVKLHV